MITYTIGAMVIAAMASASTCTSGLLSRLLQLVTAFLRSLHTSGQRALGVAAQHEALVEQRERERDDEQQHRERAAVAELRPLEAAVDQERGHGRRGVRRAAPGHDPDDVEQLQRPDHRQEDPDP